MLFGYTWMYIGRDVIEHAYFWRSGQLDPGQNGILESNTFKVTVISIIY